MDDLSKSCMSPDDLIKVGELFFGSNWSASRVGLGCRETASLVRLARQLGPGRGVYGARTSANRVGSAVVVLAAADEGPAAIKEIATRHGEAYGIAPVVLTGGVSPGAIAFGTRTVVLP
jgi:L-arabinokinase